MTQFIITATRNGQKTYLQKMEGGMILRGEITQALPHQTAENAELRRIYLQTKYPIIYTKLKQWRMFSRFSDG